MILEMRQGVEMRVNMTQARSAIENAFSFGNEQQSEWSERQIASIEPLLVEQVWREDAWAALRWNSEYRLMLAVLQDAVTCWFRCSSVRNVRERRMFQEISAWFWSDDQNWLYAFESICDHLGLEPNAIRRGLKNWPPPSLQQPNSIVQMRRVRRHKKIRPFLELNEEFA
jgi:hypothetical protein